jgi:hypothetical protein
MAVVPTERFDIPFPSLRRRAREPSGNSMTRAGYTLSILNKQNGRWVLARDANLLAPLSEETNSGDYL